MFAPAATAVQALTATLGCVPPPSCRYEFLSTGLPRELQADTAQLSGVGKLVSLNVHGLTPLALATKLGDHSMCKHILRKQCAILWVRGNPSTQETEADPHPRPRGNPSTHTEDRSGPSPPPSPSPSAAHDDSPQVWGPVTQYSMDLNNIDSVGSSSSDMMELVARMEASRETTALLLDSFLGGFLNKLFVQKWHLYGWKVLAALTAA